MLRMSQPTWFIAASERCSGSMRRTSICAGRTDASRFSNAKSTIAASYPTARRERRISRKGNQDCHGQGQQHEQLGCWNQHSRSSQPGHFGSLQDAGNALIGGHAFDFRFGIEHDAVTQHRGRPGRGRHQESRKPAPAARPILCCPGRA